MFWMVEQVRPYPISGSLLDRGAPHPSAVPCTGGDRDGHIPFESAIALFFGKFRAEETLLVPQANGPPWEFASTYPTVPKITGPKEELVEEAEGLEEMKTPPRNMSIAVFLDHLFD
ncbi:hypothetical protein C8A05DRAFT_33898 [Staphylotrichum tortipilum]|uniref:Uncharacterized protein n=1 Tax=Staphylotrichum tortipilum TaxID=2831512 RepID=A0AAN6RTP9_9PEZI|nr:hypothetical protein C8A05DRAFT_33898 [Staphylotrichum longicolle]